MTNTEALIQEWIKLGNSQKVMVASRREIAKLRNQARRSKPRQVTPLERFIQPTKAPSHRTKMRWPDVLDRPAPQRVVRDETRVESPLITARRKQYDPTVQGKRTR